MKTHHTPTQPMPTRVLAAKVQAGLTPRDRALLCCIALALGAGSWTAARAADHAAAPADHAAAPAATHKATASKTPASATSGIPGELAVDIKKALREKMIDRKQLTLVVSDKPDRQASTAKPLAAGKVSAPADAHAAPAAQHAAAPVATHAAPVAVARPKPTAHVAAPAHAPAVAAKSSRDYIKAKAAALAGHESSVDAHGNTSHAAAHWSYAGETGPQAWGQLQPEFNTCATGKRQSPINIDETYTLQGPAEPLQFNYRPTNGVVINNGHTIQVNLDGGNTLTVRGATYTLLQFHFHTPSEEQVNFRNFAMVVHLVHKNAEGQLAVVAVLLDPGAANALIDKVWTYMPLDVNDQVRMPSGMVDLNELLPKDQRYYQFIGSLTTPPCTEGVLWMVMKQPTAISKEQLRMFQQIYPNNARPVQPVNSRPVRNAQ